MACISIQVTPFEKNIEVWRQLWRVLERCDMAVQIVDARNPLMYYTEDLMKYASELQVRGRRGGFEEHMYGASSRR